MAKSERQILRDLERQVARLTAAMARINSRAVSTRSAGFRIPVVDSDPDPADPTNIWGFDDGRLRWRGSDGVVHEILPTVDERPQIPTRTSDPASSTGWRAWVNGSNGNLSIQLANGSWTRFTPSNSPGSSNDGGEGSQGSGSSSKPKQADPKPVRAYRTYAPDWVRSYCPQHGVETGMPRYYGDSSWSRSHGFRRIMIGFNNSAIEADLNGAVIRRVELHMVNRHAHFNNGVMVHFGAHKAGTPAGSFGAVRRNVWKGHWPKVGAGKYWRTVPDYFGRALRDGTIKGLVIWQPNSSNAFYGAMDPNSFRLRIHYTK